jgi:hypothetical protein
MECGAWVERLHIPVKNTYALLPNGQILLLPLRFGLLLGAQVCYVMALRKAAGHRVFLGECYVRGLIDGETKLGWVIIC